MNQDTFECLCEYARETALLETMLDLLQWDERTKLPPEGGAFRAEQMGYLTGVIHYRRTDPQLGQWLEELAHSPLAEDPHSDAGATIRRMKREYDKEVKVPHDLVEELARLAVLGQRAWADARKRDDFASFEPLLRQIVRLKREQAEAVGYTESPYDPLLDDYEPEQRTAEVARILDGLRRELVPLVEAITQSGRRPDVAIMKRHFPVPAQAAFGKRAAAAIGFDFRRGRLDVTDHPFCTTVGPDDCRITTRYDEHFFPVGFFGILHEAGHGLYDQGLPSDQFGLPPGKPTSLGIHESQSRMWENLVGRSRAFWQFFYPAAREFFPGALGDVPLDDFFFAINHVRPTPIRTEADEVTYNLHIVVRFELEQALLSGDLPVGDLPGAWNEKYRHYLGIDPPNDADGVLQDIHWGAAMIGYFPTYALGNLYAAQLFQKADEELGGLEMHFAAGRFGPLLEWLRDNVHRHGQCYTAAELVQRVTGRPLSHDALCTYLRRKFEPLYGLA